MTGVTRRDFVIAIAGAGGGLLLGCRVDGARRTVPAAAASAGDAPAPTFAPNAYVRVGSDDLVTVMLPQAEMGQGVYTNLPMLVAEELEVGLDRVRVELAPGDDKLYANPALGFQMTGGSTSTRAFFIPLRQAGATARAMLVAAAAQAWGVDPSTCRAEKGAVLHAASGRRTTYGQLAERAAKLPVPDKVPLKDPNSFTLIGTPAKRLDTPLKVNGAAQFGIDVRLAGMKVATVAASPVLGGKVAALQEKQALAVKGVRQVVNLGDVVAVVADHMWAAKQGLAALDLRWDDGPNAGTSMTDVVQHLKEASTQPGAVARNDGDAGTAIARAARKIAATYQQPYLAHAAMEPLSCTVHVQPDRCEVWCGSQVQGRARATAAEVTGLPLEQVVVHSLLMGGGFGRRLEHDYVTQAVRIAKEVRGPVKVVWTREEDIRHDLYRPYYYDRIAAGLDARGRPLGWSHRVVGSSLLAHFAPPAFKNGLDGDAVDGSAQLLYAIPSVRVEYVRQEEPAVRTTWWRGVGVTHNCFVVESFIDELAAAAKQDPVAYRRALLAKSPRAVAVLDLAAAKSGWDEPLPAGRGRGVAFLYSRWDTYLAMVAEVTASGGDIRVRRVVCAVDCGTVVNPDTVVAQVESGVIYGISGALWGEITFRNGRVEQSNFSDYRVLRMNEVPPIEVHLIRNFEAPGGMGEPGTAATGAALANAVFAATGKRIRVLPLQKGLASV